MPVLVLFTFSVSKNNRREPGLKAYLIAVHLVLSSISEGLPTLCPLGTEVIDHPKALLLTFDSHKIIKKLVKN